MDCTQVLESDVDESRAYTFKVKVAELRVNSDAIPIYSGSNRIGRDPEFCSVVFNNMTLSKEHAVIEVENQYSHLIYDLGSKNKTKLGKMLLKPHVRYQLMDKSQVQFGDLIVDYIMLPDEDGKSFEAIDESDDEVIPGTPAPGKSKDSTSSRDDSPTIFQMETECPTGYEETCTRIVTDPNECEGIQVVTVLPVGENQRASPVATTNDTSKFSETSSTALVEPVEVRKEEGEENSSTYIKEVDDGDETDPEDVFSEIKQNPTENCVSVTAAQDKCDEGEKICVENVSPAEDCSDDINSSVEKLSETRVGSKHENEMVTMDSMELEDNEEDIFCMATQVIVNKSVQEQDEEGKVVDETLDEETIGVAEENPVSVPETTNEDEYIIEPVIEDVCSENNDENVFKVPQAVQSKMTDKKMKTDKPVESTSSAEDETNEDGIFNVATQVIQMETNDADSIEETLAEVKENEQDTETTEYEKKSCNENKEELIISNDTNHEECVDEDSLYDVETQLITITEDNKVNSPETTTEADDGQDEIEEVTPDVERRQNTDQENNGDSSSETDKDSNFIFDAPTQVIHPRCTTSAHEEEVGVSEDEKNSEPNVQDSRVRSNDKKIVNENEKPIENLPDANESILEAETQIIDTKKVDSSNVPSTNPNEEENKEIDEKVLEGNDCPKDLVEEKHLDISSEDDGIFDDVTQIVDSRERDLDPQNEDKSENETEFHVEKNGNEKEPSENPETLESNSEINVEDEYVSKTPKDVESCKEDFDSFKVPNTVKKKRVDFVDVSSEDGKRYEKNDANSDGTPDEQHNDVKDENEAIFEAETEGFVIQNEKLNEKQENSEAKHKNNAVFEDKTESVEIRNDRSNDEQQSNETNDEEESILDAETQLIQISNKESNVIKASEGDNSKSSGDFTKSTEEKKGKSDQEVSSTEKSIGNTLTSDQSNNAESVLDDSDESIFCAPTQVISKTIVSNQSDEGVLSNENTNEDTPTSKQPNDVQSSVMDDGDESIFTAPTQVITKTNINSVASSQEDINEKELSLPQDSNSSILKENSTKKSPVVDADEGEKDSSKETCEGNSSTVQETEDNPANEDEFNDSFFDAPTQIFPSSGLTTFQEEAEDQIKKILNRLEDEDDDDDDDNNKETNNRPKSPPETKKISDIQETQDLSDNENVNGCLFEAATQIVSFNAPEETSDPQDGEKDKVVPTNLSRSSSYDSVHEAATQCIDDLEMSGQNLPVVGKSVANSIIPDQSSSEADKNGKENLERSLGDETLQDRQPVDASTPVNINRSVELILPSSQELRKAGEECYGAASDDERPTTSNDVASPVVQKRTRNRLVARRGILVTEDVETVKPVGVRVSFLNNSGLPSTSKTELPSEIDGKECEPVVSGSRRRLRISTKNIVKKPNQSEEISTKKESENDKSKKQPSRKSIRKGNEIEGVSSEKNEDEEFVKLDRNVDKKNTRGMRNKAVKELSHQEDNAELSNDAETGSRPSRQRKMTWKARENREENQSPDSKGKKDEKNESLNVSSTSSTKYKAQDSSPSNANESRTRRARVQSMKEDSNTKSKPANNKVLPEMLENSNVLLREKVIIEHASPLADKKEEKIGIEKRGSKRSSKATSSSKPESKTDSKKGQTTLEKWCGSPNSPAKHKKDDISSSVESGKKNAEELSTRSRSKHSNNLNSSSDSFTELVHNKRKQDVDISETLKKLRRTRVASSSDRDIENKLVTSICLVEVNNLPDTNTKSKVRSSAVLSKRKQILESSVSSVGKEGTPSAIPAAAPGDAKEEPSQRGRSRRSVRRNDSSSNTELESAENQSQDEKKENSKISPSINRRRTTRSASSSSDQDKKVEETKQGRSKRSSAVSATIPEVSSKRGEATENKRKQDSVICESPKKQRKTSNVAHDDQLENVSVKSRSKSKRNSGKSGTFGPDTESKVADEDGSQDVVLQTPRSQRKTRIATLPVANQDTSEDSSKKSRSKRSTPVGNPEALKQESKSGKSATQALHTPPRSGRNRNTARQTLPSEQKAEQPGATKRNNKQVPLIESDSSVCGSPVIRSTGRKRKLPGLASSTESDGQSSQGEGTPKRSSRLKQQIVHHIMFTGVMCSEEDEAVIKKLGGKIVQEPEECSILITDKIRRTLKFLCTVGQGKPIVSPDWLKQSHRSGQFLDPWNFIVKDKEVEKKYSFQLQKSLKLAASKKLLEGHSVFATPSVKPPPAEMKGIVENCGGEFLAQESSSNKWPAQCFIISAPKDKKLCAKWKKTSVPIVSAEVLLTGILQQKLNVNDYLLKL